MKNIILSGPKRAGKSTIVESIVSRSTCTVGGFLTRRIYENSRHVGFEMVDLRGGREIFAQMPTGAATTKAGRFVVDVDVFDRFGVSILQKALAEAELILMDEIGCMEDRAVRFKQTVKRCFESARPVVVVIQKADCRFVNELLLRRDSSIFCVTPKNREEFRHKLLTDLAHLGLVKHE